MHGSRRRRAVPAYTVAAVMLMVTFLGLGITAFGVLSPAQAASGGRAVPTVAAATASSAPGSADVAPSALTGTSPASTAATPDPLAEEKLQEEIRHLRMENDRSDSFGGTLLLWAPFVTVLVGVVTLLTAFIKQSSDMKQARATMADDREKERKQNEQWHEEFLRQNQKDSDEREQQSLRRFDSNLAQIIANLGSNSRTLRVNAAASIAMYLQPRYFEFHSELLTVLVANLRLGPDKIVADLLRSDLERAVNLIAAKKAYHSSKLGGEIDLTHLNLKRLSLANVNLNEATDADSTGIVVDVAYSDLTNASLRDAKLWRCRGIEVVLAGARCSGADLGEARLNKARCLGAKFHDATLVSATLKGADLRRAEFFEARLQGAHLENADLSGADFTQANLAETFFGGCTFDAASLQTVVHAVNWRKAHFDYQIRTQLEGLSAVGHV